MDYKLYFVRSGAPVNGYEHTFIMRLPANTKPLDLWDTAENHAMYNVTVIEEVTFSDQNNTYFISGG